MDRAMEIVKKNLVSIICGVVALIAILAVFWPIGGMFAELQTRAGTRAGTYSQLRDLLTKERHLPVVALDNGATGEPLTVFPTEPVIQRGEKVKKDIEAEAEAMYREAVRLNQGDKKLLEARALPQPPANQATAILNTFQRAYAQEMDYANPDPAARAKSMPGREMKVTIVPTAEQIKAEQERRAKIIRMNELQRDPQGKPLNQPQVDAKIAEQTALVGDQMRHDAAKQGLVYVDPPTSGASSGSFDLVERIMPPARSLQLHDVFWAQVGYWVHHDVCRAIADANAGATDVTNAAVKRVLKVDLPEFTPPQQFHGFTMPVAATPSEGINEGGDGGMSAMPTDPSQPITPNYSISPTGRYSNPLYDVVQFRLSLIVDAARIPQVLQALSKNRFLTVYKTDINIVDSGDHQAQGYIYGTRPVVEMNMDCEVLFMREWTRQYMAPIVKRALGVVDPPPAQ